MLHITLFGTPTLTLDNQPVTGFVSGKAAALAFYLAATDRVHGRDALATMLWADVPESQAKRNLRDILSNLRRLIGPYLHITRQTAGMDPDAPHIVDVLRFDAAIAQIVQVPSSTRSTTAERMGWEELRAVANLYQGEFLEGFNIHDAPVFEEWVLGERERYHLLALQVLKHVMTQCQQNGRYLEGIDVAMQVLALEPWDEEAHRGLMAMLAANGQQKAALAQYDACCRVLLDEFGAEPEPETTDLYERIRTSGGQPRHNLPENARLTAFVGRARELSEILRLLADPACRLLTIVGLGGVGKTRLALHVANQSLNRYLDGVYFVPLSSLGGPDFLVSAIAEELALAFSGSEDPKQQLLNYLRNKQLLLVLDNFEQLLDGADLLAEILRAAPNVKILVTSRERLNLAAERLFEVTGLPVPPDTAVVATGAHLMTRFDAVQLFLQSARHAVAEFAPVNAQGEIEGIDNEELRWIAQICRLVDGMPLGIELAASWLAVLSCREIADELARGIGFLETALRDVPARHRSMSAVFDYSWRMLKEQERRTFQQLAIFQGRFTREAAQRVTGATLLTLSSLVHKSLLRRIDEGYYVIHNLLRQYVEEQHPLPAETARTTRAAFCTYYADFLYDRARRAPHDQQRMDALNAIGNQIRNVRTAGGMAVADNNFAAIDRGLDGIYGFYSARNWFAEGAETFAHAVRYLVQPPPMLLARLQARQAMLLCQLGQNDAAQSLFQKALIAARAAADVPEMAFCLAGLATVAIGQSAVDAAQRTGQESLALFQKLGDSHGCARVLNLLGAVALSIGSYETALESLIQAQTLAQEAGLGLEEATSLRTQGQVYWNQGNYAAATSAYSQAADLFRKPHIADRQGEANALSDLGFVAWSLGDYDAARNHFERALVLFRNTGDLIGEARALENLGRAAERHGDFADARLRYLQAQAIVAEIGYRQGVGACLADLGFLAYHQGDYAGAWSYFDEALAIYREVGDRRGQGLLLACFSLLAHLGGDNTAAEEHARQSLALARAIGDRIIQGFALTHLGYALAGQERWPAAIAAYTEAHTIRQEMGDLDKALEPLAGLAAIALAQDDLNTARRYADEMTAFLEHDTLDRVLSMFYIYSICYRILSALDDSRARPLLQRAYCLLIQRAQGIPTEAERATFLYEIALHRALVDAVEADRALQSAGDELS